MSKESEEARERVTAAIKDYLIACGDFNPDEELVNQWGIIVNLEKVEDNGMSGYYRFYSTPTVPPHIASGLFYEALNGIGE